LAPPGTMLPGGEDMGDEPAFGGLDYSIGRLKTGLYQSLRTAWSAVFRTVYHHTSFNSMCSKEIEP